MRKPVDKSGQARIASGVCNFGKQIAMMRGSSCYIAMQDGFTSELTTAASYIFPETGLK